MGVGEKERARRRSRRKGVSSKYCLSVRPIEVDTRGKERRMNFLVFFLEGGGDQLIS